MNTKIIVVSILIIIVGMLYLSLSGNKSENLVSSQLLQVFRRSTPTSTSTPTPVPTPNAPKTFQFNSKTDLKMELEKVNSQVLDSDFE